MGLVRFILAVAVLSEHSDSIAGLRFMSASTAVVAFYIISGFYMSLILNEKYIHQKESYKLFITNRFLRIYPVYWIVLIMTFLVFFISRMASGDPLRAMVYVKYFSMMPFSSIVFLMFTNIFIFGQDVISFMGYDPGNGFIFSAADSRVVASWFLLIPQAWSISIELMFYLIAPFFVKQRWHIIAFLMLLSFSLRVLLYYNGYNNNSWTKTFFPLELGFFLAGCLSYNIYRVLKSKQWKRQYLQSVFVLFIIISLFLPLIDLQWYPKTYIYCLLTVFSIPFIFYLTRQNSFDRYIGELSYPIYITHFFTLDLCSVFDVPWNYRGAFNLLFCIIVSILLIEFVSKPIERYRQARVKK